MATKIMSMLGGNKKIVESLSQELSSYQSDIKHATNFIKEIEKGNLEVQYGGDVNEAAIDKNSLAGSLISMRDQMKVYEEQERERKWVTEGLAKFVEILRADNTDIRTLCDKITSNIVRYLDANQGYLFILNDTNEHDVHLELMACYAYDRKKYMDKRVAIGEGMLGQTFLEAQTLYLTNIPNGYVEITSGLGAATPGCLAIVPLIINEVTYGLLEIASFQNIEKYQIDFLEKLGESIASTISTSKINQKTQKLLEESREMTEMMRSQEEEMRQNMEELQATQEEMEKKSREIELKFNSLERCDVAYVEFNMDGYVEYVNQSFCNTMGYKREEVLDQHDSKFVSNNYRFSDEYRQLWEKLKKGEAVKGEFERVKSNGDIVFIKATYTCLTDISGKPYKIIKIFVDITENKKLVIDSTQKAEELQSQSEQLNQVLEEMNATQEELQRSKDEIEKIRIQEKDRADAQITAQKKVMEAFVEKSKKTEAELKAKIQMLEEELKNK